MQTQLFIGGEFVDALDGNTIEVLDPHDGSLLAQVAEAGAADVDRAVAAAGEAHAAWGRMPAAVIVPPVVSFRPAAKVTVVLVVMLE